MPSTPSRSASSFQGLDGKWSDLYAVLDTLVEKLRVRKGGDNLDEFHKSIQRAREVETSTVRIYTRMSMFLAQAKAELARVKAKLNAEFRSLISSPEIENKKKDYVISRYLWEDQEQVEKVQQSVQQIQTYLECVDRILSTVKHSREDLGRRIRVLDVQREIQELPKKW